MSKSKKTVIEDEFITRDDLRDYIHSIHNFLRNTGAGYGQTGVKIFSVFYGLKLIQPYLGTLGLSKEQQKILDFNELFKKSQESSEIGGYIDGEVLDVLWNLKNLDLDKIKKPTEQDIMKKNLGHFIFHQIPRDLKDKVWKELIWKINKIPVGFKKERKVNLSGKVWEYFVGRDDTAISELGAYFTDRHITDFIFSRIKPELNEDGNIPTMIDPFGGSGGFTLGYANYMRENCDEVDWISNVNNIFHFDMEESVVNMTGLEMFAITGHFPKRDHNYVRGNTFSSEFIGSDNKPMQWDYLISNPPYGGDKTTKNAEQIKRDKLIEFIKAIDSDTRTDKLNDQLKDLVKASADYKKEQEKHQVKLDNCSQRIKSFAKKYKIDTANDKEACSLILLMDMVAPGGTCCGVLKEGVFFDGKYSKLRQVLIENFNVTDVISVPQNAFENTSTKTSIIIFKAGGKTKKINFSELVVEKEEQDVIEIGPDGLVHMVLNKDEIKKVIEKPICSATYKQIAEPTIVKGKGAKAEDKERYDYSLNYKNYKDYKVVCPAGYELRKLGDIVKFNGKSKRLAEFATEDGKFRYYSSGGKILKCDKADFVNDLSIIIGHSGNGCLFIDNTFSTLITNHVLQSDNKQLLNYIYNYINQYWNVFYEQCYKGTTVKNTSDEEIKKFQIPVPKDIIKLAKPLESLQKLHQQISQDTEAIPAKEKAICDLIKKLTDEGKEGTDYDSHKINKLFSFSMGKNKLEDINNNGIYNYYRSSSDNPFGKSYKYCFDNNNVYLLFIWSGGNAKNKISDSHGLGKTYIVQGKIAANKAVYMLNPITEQNTKYVKYFLDIIKPQIQESANYTTGLGNVNMEQFKNQNIKVLKPAIMKKHKLQELFDEVDNLKTQLEANKVQYQKQMDELFVQFKDHEDDTKTKPNQAKLEDVDSNEDESDEENQAESESDEQSKLCLDSKTKVTTFVEPVKIEIKGKVKKVAPKEFDV